MSFTKMIIFVWGLFLDILGLVNTILDLGGVGILFSFLIDFLGIFTIGMWAWFRGLSVAEVPTKIGQKILKRFGIAVVSELIPFWGDIFPSWTVFVFTSKE
ncbi:MAG TPA: hypothetical protein ENG32_00410 [bacterium]|nr:hypothetical protein [bacterium]